MKTKCSSLWIFTVLAAVVLMMASCGNSQKKRERAAERRGTEQALDTVTVYESETVVVTIDSLAPDSAAVRQNVATPKRTK